MAELHRIKRYANRKLYDTTTSRYVSLEKIHALIQQGLDVVILDSQTGEDITSITLAQVMVEAEKHSRNVLPLDALKDMLQRSGESVRDFLEQTRRAGRGALSLADEARERTYRRLVEQGEVTEDEARDFLNSIGDNMTKQRRDLERGIDKRVRDVVDAMRLPSRAEIQDLSKKVDRIITKVDGAIGGGNQKTAGRKATKAKPRATKGV